MVVVPARLILRLLMDKLPEYLRETVDWFMGYVCMYVYWIGFILMNAWSVSRKTRGSRGRLGDRNSEDSGGVQKLYLHENLLELRVPEPELIYLTDLPGGLDVNEWIASHSKLVPTRATLRCVALRCAI